MIEECKNLDPEEMANRLFSKPGHSTRNAVRILMEFLVSIAILLVTIYVTLHHSEIVREVKQRTSIQKYEKVTASEIFRSKDAQSLDGKAIAMDGFVVSRDVAGEYFVLSPIENDSGTITVYISDIQNQRLVPELKPGTQLHVQGIITTHNKKTISIKGNSFTAK